MGQGIYRFGGIVWHALWRAIQSLRSVFEGRTWVGLRTTGLKSTMMSAALGQRSRVSYITDDRTVSVPASSDPSNLALKSYM